MQSKTSLKRLLLIAGATVVGFSLLTIFFLTFYLPGHVYAYYFITPSHTLGLPVRLQIPKINVDAVVEHLGLTPEGAMAVPKGPADVAWFNLGPRPGDTGNAVIAGHYGRWKNGGGSVFDNLNTLKAGDKIYIKDKNGVTTTFIVRELRKYGQNEYAPEVFNSDDEKAHLNLITCEGTWIEAQKTYSNRLVVFTDKE